MSEKHLGFAKHSGEFLPDSLYHGDCLNWMQQWLDAGREKSADLIYLDPPFNSQQSYNIIFGKTDNRKAQLTAFNDAWYWNAAAAGRVDRIQGAVGHAAHKSIAGLRAILGPTGMLSYLSYMAERLALIHKLLKPTGSVLLHCDPTASHYLKIVLDDIFGAKNYRNEIVWHYASPGGRGGRHYPKKHDAILYYTKSVDYTFNGDASAVRAAISDTSEAMHYNQADASGRKYREQTAGGKTYRYYLDHGKLIDTVWSDIKRSGSNSPLFDEYTGYPTQKPLALLERLIAAHSNRGDLVLDPFCGCATTVVAARKLKRKWVGIDISSFAINFFMRTRLRDTRVPIAGLPVDFEGADDLARRDRLQFQQWMVSQVQGLKPNEALSGDGGFDGEGKIYDAPGGRDLVIAEVKSGKVGVAEVRAFCGVIERRQAALGLFLTLDKLRLTPAIAAEAAALKRADIRGAQYPRLQFYSAREFFDGRRANLPEMRNPFTGKPLHKDFLDLGT